MTKKDYTLFAKLLNDASQAVFSHATEQAEVVAFQDGKRRALQQVAQDFARVATQENPRFDRERFLVAAGVR